MARSTKCQDEAGAAPGQSLVGKQTPKGYRHTHPKAMGAAGRAVHGGEEGSGNQGAEHGGMVVLVSTVTA